MWFGRVGSTSTLARLQSGRFSFNRGAHSVLGNAVTTLWMTCCINQCLKIMILKLFKLKTKKKKDFGCLPWVGYLLESHAVELLKKVHMELSPLMFFFEKITCWIYQYNGIYIFLFSFLLFFFFLFFISFIFFPFCFWLLRAYMIQLKCQSYALEKQTLQHKRLLGPYLGGIPQIKT